MDGAQRLGGRVGGLGSEEASAAVRWFVISITTGRLEMAKAARTASLDLAGCRMGYSDGYACEGVVAVAAG